MFLPILLNQASPQSAALFPEIIPLMDLFAFTKSKVTFMRD
jgi:hypothetical protein